MWKVSKTSKKIPRPPHNPELRNLVEEKRRWTSKIKSEDAQHGFRGWNERGYLPHRDEPGLIQFVTFRLADSFPESLRSEWNHLWEIENDRERRLQIEKYLDRCRGSCYLRRAEIARLVEDNLRQNSHSRGSRELRYELRAWCIMPNHVHVLFKVGSASMSEIIGGWKKHTARLANRFLKRRGAFWAEDYFDTFMRDAEHEYKTIRYIENNPTKAKLVLDPKEWSSSSARFRDHFGILRPAV